MTPGAVVAGLLLVALAAIPVSAQWLHQRDPSLARLPNGEPDLSASAPKLADGTPDLSGVWVASPDRTLPAGGVENAQPPRYFVSVAGGFDPGSVPMLPWAAELFAQRRADFGKDQPTSSCKPLGTPWRPPFPLPFKVVQTRDLIVMLYEHDNVFRQVFLDGRPLPDDPQPSYLGYSVGRFEDGALVVTTTGFRDLGWLDAMGHPHSDQLRMEERYRRLDTGHMEVQVTFHDPKTYTEDIGYTQPMELLPDTDVMEYFCQENEQDQPHLVGASAAPKE